MSTPAAPPPEDPKPREQPFEWGQSCSRERLWAEAGAYRPFKGWAVGQAYWTGEEWRVPYVRIMSAAEATLAGLGPFPWLRSLGSGS